MISTETIAAIATAPGRGGVAVIRISGPDAFAVAARLAGKLPAPGRFAFRRLESTTLLDEALVLSFKAPHSYTGEDVVEFQCHGGSVTPRRVLEACLAAGARIARRGEFTERAFLNGRLDYDQAESVLDLIDAKTERAAAAALAGLTGDRKRTLQARYDELLALSSKVEHALDIEEGELPEEFALGLERELGQVRSALTATLRELKEGKLLREGALVVLAGPPNAGKSSLLNALLGENRAIVSPIAGTTRDSIEAWVDLEGWPVRLVDTAGLRTTEDEIEGEGVRRAEALIAEADVVVRLVPPEAAEHELRPAAAQELAVRSKADLPGRAAPGELAISVKTGAGISALKAAIVARLEAKAAVSDDLGSDPDAAMGALLASRAALPPSMADLVLAGNALARAADLIGKPLGAVYSEDLLTALFSRFCVGK